MCGLIAFYSSSKSWEKEALVNGSKAMIKRGPDAEGEWWSDDCKVAMAHRRLAIIDLNNNASQPMESMNKRFIIVFNGEIYNYSKLREDLIDLGVRLKTQSDTEVILELFSLYGKSCLKRLRGMFTFAIWDKLEECFFIARDPYGIKPLYVAKTDKGFIIASQVKAILSTGVVSNEKCPYGQGGYWLLGTVPEPYTWFKNITAVPAGHYLIINKLGIKQREWASIAEYWQVNNQSKDQTNLTNHVKKSLHDTVKSHLVSDVPVGIFLSGGIDSASLLAIMKDLGVSKTTCITLRYSEFEGSRDDESIVAEYLANKYGFKHHLRTVTREEFENDLQKIFSAMDQPSIDGINTWYASKCASELGLKVVLSGVGGDELFQGYKSFRFIPLVVKFWGIASKVPGLEAFVELILQRKSRLTKNPRWNLFVKLAKTIPGAWFLQRSVYAPDELSNLMEKNLADKFLKNFSAENMILNMSGDLPKDSKLAMSQIYSTCYLKNQLLRDSDWASMGHSVELRTPLVDIELLRSLKPIIPSFYKFKNKSLLSNAPNNPLDNAVATRKKTGFSIPVHQWIKEINPNIDGAGLSRTWAREVAENVYKDLD
jgi:asparagine synthase (glutamine-hydrolysing)